ncbi:hypothetical protein COCCADRAFT_92119, partial [Bipolaris zeicola 26-R-13]
LRSAAFRHPAPQAPRSLLGTYEMIAIYGAPTGRLNSHSSQMTPDFLPNITQYSVNSAPYCYLLRLTICPTLLAAASYSGRQARWLTQNRLSAFAA